MARKLIEDAQLRARSDGCDHLSLIVVSENSAAKKLYEHIGFKDVSSKPVVPYPGCSHGGKLVLMTKPIDGV